MANKIDPYFPILDYQNRYPLRWNEIDCEGLKDAIAAFGEGSELSDEQYYLLKSYFIYFIYAPCYEMKEIYSLRIDALTMVTPAQMQKWLNKAAKAKINPMVCA